MTSQELLGGGRPIHLWHVNIHENNISLQGSHYFQRLSP